MNRRTFALAAATAFGANERVRVGLIGSGGRGRFLAGEFKEVGLEVAGVCDVYEPNLAAGLKVASTGAKSFDNYKRLLDDKSFDAVVVATPDHWHSRMVIDAVEAGKDVYVEKPLAHTIQEGFDMIAAVRRTKRIVQVGTQRRSSELFQRAKELAAPKSLGDVRLVTSHWLNHTAALSQRKLEGKLDWEQWLGPAAKQPASDFRFFNWYYFWDYSGGLLVGQAAHIVDAIIWFMGSGQPSAVTCTGGQVNLAGGEIPETAIIAIEFPDNYLATFTLGYKAMRYNAANDQLMQFHGSKARLDVGREGYALYPESNVVEMKPSAQESLPGSFGSAARSHIRNFLECIRSRKEPNAPVEAAQSTNIVLVMALASLRAGRRLRWDAASRRVI